ncbi:Laccase I [Mycena kentingensis (nom. inval.)]|nr:Laccase I [Mycena kentingensis (nom. inval.)]
MVLASAASLLVVSAAAAATSVIGPAAQLPIVNRVIAPDGFSRSTVLAGGTFPGPLIRGNKGATFSLNVVDLLTDSTMLKSTSIHWHGFFQAGMPWEDGPAFVTQCPITPQHAFNYNFKAPGQAGTFWYHSHLSTQYCDGLRGPFVVYDPQDPHKHLYDIDDGSLSRNRQPKLHADVYAQKPPSSPWQIGSVFALPQSARLGLGRYAGGPLSKLAVITVVPKKRYRFRIVSISCDPNFVFSIDGHSMTIIEVDGVNHKPLTVDSLQIFAGQRYSAVFTANQPVGNYWIRNQPNALPGSNTGFVNGTNSAILRYVGAPIREPTTTSNLVNPLIENNLKPLVRTPVPGKPVPGGADVNLNLVITLDASDPAAVRFAINNASFIPPTAPVLLQILSGAQYAQDLLPPGSVYELPPNEVIEISIPGGSAGAPHPFHLHGHNFFVVRSAGNSSYNFVDAPIRDVVSTGASTDDLTTFRFVTDNAGPWFLHCHIDWHLDIGLAVVLAENVPKIATFNPPPAWDQLCPIYDASDKD